MAMRFRQSSCAHFSALIVVLANILISPTHPSKFLDLQMAAKSIRLFEQIIDVVRSPLYSPLHRIIEDLYKSATKVVDDAPPERLEDGSGALSSARNIDPVMDMFTDQSEFSVFDYNEGQLGNFEFDGMFGPLVGEDDFGPSQGTEVSGTQLAL